MQPYFEYMYLSKSDPYMPYAVLLNRSFDGIGGVSL